ncbi:MAG: phosphotransferase [Acidobacteriota bacterium]|nr:phosphotransferase [Acidobacteriota bacterium]
MPWPDAEFLVTTSLVRELLRRQHPEFAQLTLRRAGEGFDNVQFRLGADLVVRLPRRAIGAELVVKEIEWLAEVTRDLPVTTPAPVVAGHPEDVYPWPWAIERWIEGRAGDGVALATRAANVDVIVEILRGLRRPAPSTAPRNPVRGCALVARQQAFLEHLGALEGNRHEWLDRWAWARDAAAPNEETWLHGDLHPGNLIFRDGTLVGVVDFGDLGVGDPATDLAGALLLVPFATTLEIVAQLQPEADELRRALGWGMLFASVFLSLGSRRASYARVGDLARANVTQWMKQIGGV